MAYLSASPCAGLRRAGPGLGAAPAAVLDAAAVPRGAVGFGAPLLAGPGRGLAADVARGAVGFGVALGLADDRGDVVAPLGALACSAGGAGSAA